MSVLPEKSGPEIVDPRPIPNGWHGIGFIDELAPGAVVSRHILGRDLVLFRSQAGRLTVADAYCPHMGAHLGRGGVVVEDRLRCPYHHWEFDGAGACAHMPYGTRAPAAARLRTYPVQETNGLILIWYDAKERAPSYEIPAHPITEDPDYYYVERREKPLFNGHPQDIAENGADFGHFIAVHGWTDVKLRWVSEGPSYHLAYDTEQVETGLGEKGGVGIESRTFGPGYSYSHYTGETDLLMVSCYTPVDPGVLYLHHTYYAHRSVPRIKAKAVIDGIDAAWFDDIAIWTDKAYRERPALNDGDGPIAQFRRWYRQFYE